MLDWFSETMLKIVTSVPALLVAKDSPYFYGRSSDVRIDPDRARRLRHCPDPQKRPQHMQREQAHPSGRVDRVLVGMIA